MKSYDQNLRLALEEIKEVLRKRDCMGAVSLNSKTHGEFYIHLAGPSWSYFKTEIQSDGSEGLRLKAKGIKAGTTEHENLEGNVAAVCNFADLFNSWSQSFYRLKATLQNYMDLDHTPLTRDRINNDDRVSPS